MSQLESGAGLVSSPYPLLVPSLPVTTTYFSPCCVGLSRSQLCLC